MSTRAIRVGLLCCSATLAQLILLPAAGAEEAGEAARAPGATLELEEVIVTASKRSESAAQVPGSVTALGTELLEQINAANFQDFAAYVPGVSSFSAGTGWNQVVVRGVTTGQGGSATVATQVDEVPIGSSNAHAIGSNSIDFSAFDLERIELLSGPQGTLYGASSLGGLLKYVTRAPDPAGFAALLETEGLYTEDGGFNPAVRLAVNAPVVTDKLAVRADIVAAEDEGFIDDPDRGLRDVNSSTTRAGRLSMLALLTPDLSLRLSAVGQRIEADGLSSSDRDALTGEPIEGELDQSVLVDEGLEQKLELYSAVLDWDLGWGTLTSVSGWHKVNFDSDLDLTRTFLSPVPVFAAARTQTEKFSQEIRLASAESTSFEWMLGAFYADEDNTLTSLIQAGQPNSPLGAPIFYGVIPTTYEELAGFANATVYLTEKFDVTAGVRVARNEQEYEQEFSGLLINPLNPSMVFPGSADSSETVDTYLFSARYRISDDTMLYARAASGYRPGGPNFTLLDPVTGQPIGEPTFDADTLWNYELGTKMSLLDGRATLDFSIYRIDWKDIQIAVTRGVIRQLENASDAQVDGIEAAARFLVTRGLTLGGSASYSDARLTEDAVSLGASKDQRLPGSPQFSATLTVDYNFPLTGNLEGWVGLSERYVGDSKAGFDGSLVKPQYDLDAFNLVDLRAGFGTEQYRLNFFLKNALNEIGEISADASALAANPTAPVRVTVTPPRTVGLEFIVSLGQ